MALALRRRSLRSGVGLTSKRDCTVGALALARSQVAHAARVLAPPWCPRRCRWPAGCPQAGRLATAGQQVIGLRRRERVDGGTEAGDFGQRAMRKFKDFGQRALCGAATAPSQTAQKRTNL